MAEVAVTDEPVSALEGAEAAAADVSPAVVLPEVEAGAEPEISVAPAALEAEAEVAVEAEAEVAEEAAVDVDVAAPAEESVMETLGEVTEVFAAVFADEEFLEDDDDEHKDRQKKKKGRTMVFDDKTGETFVVRKRRRPKDVWADFDEEF